MGIKDLFSARYTSPRATSPLFPRPTRSGSVGSGAELDNARETLLLPPSENEELASDLSTAFNIVNNFVGMILLSMAYTFALAGWTALPLLALLTAFGGYTGELIVASYATIAARGEAVPSYAKIGEAAAGPAGKWLVLVSSVVETYFALVTMNIITWQNVELMLPDVPLGWIILGCVVLSLPTNWLRDFNRLAFLSAFGFACVVFICAVVAYQLALLWIFEHGVPAGDDAPPPRHLVRAGGVPMAASIILAGLTGHVSLPPIYASMKKPSHFTAVNALSFLVMFGLYAFVGVCGYGLFGDENHVLITVDMTLAARTMLDRVLVVGTLAGMTFKLFCSVPMCIVVLTDIAENITLERTGRELEQSRVMFVRLLTWFSGVLLSVVFYRSLQYVTAFIGVNSLLISIILPIAFYWKIHREALGWWSSAWYASLLIFSLFVTVLVSWVDIADYLEHLAAH